MPIWSLDICDKLKGLHFGFSTGINVLSWVRTLLLNIAPPPPSLLLTELGSQQLPCLAHGWSRDNFLGFPLVKTRQGQGYDRKRLVPGTATKLQKQFQCFRIIWTKLILHNKIPGATGLRTFTWLIVWSSHDLNTLENLWKLLTGILSC